ncbi:hypothetical protein [Lacticaseibacillus daqingensis]|uniref:hypothetical protein n=1 Tax=Lacticaseibacillus daqingensis TaxID=2486014 RepID=UPI000F7862B6|nr:hypothetical protein [Lacticaseibacillus daqingensis]
MVKISTVKVIAGVSLLYLIFTFGVLLAAGIKLVPTGFNMTALGQLMLEWEPHWWWLSIIGGGMHVFAFICSLRRNRLLIANTVCLWAFIAYALVPNFTVIIAVCHALALLAIFTYHRPREVEEAR